MTDMAQQNLREPERVDWDSAFSGSKYAPPLPALNANGEAIPYSGKIVSIKQSDGKGLDEGYLNYEIDVQLPGVERPLRTWASTRTFSKRNADTGGYEPLKGNPNALGKVLKAAGLQARPQTNAEYQAAARMVAGKPVTITLNWEARSKDGSEKVSGYEKFPMDPENPGQRKSVLKRGDLLSDETMVQSEVLFANARIKHFLNPTPTVRK